MVKISLPGGKEGGAEPASPCRPFPRVLYDRVCVRARLAAVCHLVVLVEAVGSPENSIAVGTWVLFEPFVELFLVAFPVKLALESSVAGRARVRLFRSRGWRWLWRLEDWRRWGLLMLLLL